LNECFKVNDFDQETYENKIYGDYKIKSKKPATPLIEAKPQPQVFLPQIQPISNDIHKETAQILSNFSKKNEKIEEKNDKIEKNNKIEKNEKNENFAIIQTNTSNFELKTSLKPEFSSEILHNSSLNLKRPSPTELFASSLKKIKENHYFSKKHLIFDPFSCESEELFGLNHSLYLNNNLFLLNYLKSKENNQSFLSLLSLQKPFKLSSHFYLSSLGDIFFSKSLRNSFDKNPENLKKNDIETMQFGNGFCTFRMYKSFINTGLLVYYYQYKLYIKEIDQVFYVILSEDSIAEFHNSDLLLFHTNLSELMKNLLKKIQEKQKEETSFRAFRFMPNKKCFFPTILPEIIYMKILKKCSSNTPNTLNIDLNLQETFNKLQIQNTIGNTICESLEPFINQFFESQLKKYSIAKMHLGDFFFGYNHPKIQALVKLFRKNKTFSLNRLPEELRDVFCNISPFLKLKQKLTFTDLQDMKIPLPYKCLRL